jgi:hypothetical protein
MSKTKVLLGSAALAIGLTALVAGPAQANHGADFCVTGTAPVKMGPDDGSTTVGYVHVAEAWHDYYTTGNWSSGYVSRTNPLVRGFVALGFLDHSRTPTEYPDGSASC